MGKYLNQKSNFNRYIYFIVLKVDYLRKFDFLLSDNNKTNSILLEHYANFTQKILIKKQMDLESISLIFI